MRDIAETLFSEMDSQLRSVSERLAFIQLRVSAESFVRNECAIAANRAVHDLHYHVHMEKKAQGKIVDLLVVLTTDGNEDFERAIQVELKMAWPGGLPENAIGVRNDLAALANRDSAYVVALFFGFERSPDWTPYGPRKIGFQDGLAQFINFVGEGEPVFAGEPFPIVSSEAIGRA